MPSSKYVTKTENGKEFFTILLKPASKDLSDLKIPKDLYSAIVYVENDQYDQGFIQNLAKKLFIFGVRYVMADGTASPSVETDFDLERVDFDQNESSPVIMTTSHSKESIEDVIFFADMCANFYGEEEIKKCLIISINNAEKIKEYVKHLKNKAYLQ